MWEKIKDGTIVFGAGLIIGGIVGGLAVALIK